MFLLIHQYLHFPCKYGREDNHLNQGHQVVWLTRCIILTDFIQIFVSFTCFLEMLILLKSIVITKQGINPTLHSSALWFNRAELHTRTYVNTDFYICILWNSKLLPHYIKKLSFKAESHQNFGKKNLILKSAAWTYFLVKLYCCFEL